MNARGLALFALALCAGCDDSVRVGLVLHTNALTPAQVASVADLSIEAQYNGAQNGATDATKLVTLGNAPLEEPERIELFFPDATTQVTLDVTAIGASGAIAEVRSATVPLSHGITTVELSLPGPLGMQTDLGASDLSTDLAGDLSTDLATPIFVTLAPINVGAATTAAIVGNWENTGDELVVATAGGVAYKLSHMATAPYLAAPVSLSLSPIAAQPMFASTGRSLAAATTAGMACLFTLSDSSVYCDNTGIGFTAIAAGVAPISDLGMREIITATTNVGLEQIDPVAGTMATLDPVGGGGAIVFAKLDGDAADVAYAVAGSIRICHGLTTCGAGPAIVATTITSLAAVDLDLDGKMDLFAFEGTLGHYLHNQGGTPATFVASGTLTAIGSPVFGDFNGDGFPDLAYITADKLGIIVAMLTGTTTPVATPLLNVGSGLFALRAADLDGKAPLDLVAVDTTGKVTPIVHP